MPTIMVAPVVAVVVLVIPMSVVHFPAFAIVVVMRMGPVCSFKRKTLPVSPHPLVMVTNWRPIPLHPDEAGIGRRPGLFINDGRWRGPDIHRNLGRTRGGDSGCEHCAIHPMRSHPVSPFLWPFKSSDETSGPLASEVNARPE